MYTKFHPELGHSNLDLSQPIGEMSDGNTARSSS